MGAVAQRAEARDVIGMQMGIDRLNQLEVELANELQVALDLFQYGIDDQRFAATPAGEQVGVGARNAVEELAEDHGKPRLLPRLLLRRCWQILARSPFRPGSVIERLGFPAKRVERKPERRGRDSRAARGDDRLI